MNRIFHLTERAPKGWLQHPTPAQYAGLGDRQKFYKPVYAKYRERKYRAYDECGRFLGWEPEQVGIGQPIYYTYVGYIAAAAVDAILHSNVLLARILAR